MTSFYQVKFLPYIPEELFKLVLDIESYPQFLPWCAAARIISKSNTEIIAELVVQVKGFSEKYQSKITWEALDNGGYLINTIAISGPFKYLKSTWQFLPYKKKAAIVKFNIDFQMKSIIIQKLIGNYFVKATEKIINAFEKRASCITKKLQISKKINVN